jgi:hypothetical protein
MKTGCNTKTLGKIIILESKRHAESIDGGELKVLEAPNFVMARRHQRPEVEIFSNNGEISDTEKNSNLYSAVGTFIA